MGVAAIAGAIAEPSRLKKIFGYEPMLIGPPGQELLIDIIESESPEYTYEITTFPVESGCDITDHVIERPASVTLSCVFTDFQFSAKNIISGIINNTLSLATWLDKKDHLYKLKDSRKRVNISTSLHLYDNYIIESIMPNLTAGSGDCFRCNITARSARIVSSSVGFIDPELLPNNLKASVSKKTKPRQNRGSAQTTSSSRSTIGIESFQ